MIAPINSQNLPVTSVLRSAAAAKAQGAISGPAFGQALERALKAVSQSQANAAQAQTAVQFEKEGASIEQAMISMQKANVAFTAAVTVRNKMVSAYTDIMNMQV